jgi:hypothetical protein
VNRVLEKRGEIKYNSVEDAAAVIFCLILL